jgi:hypothetical protein
MVRVPAHTVPELPRAIIRTPGMPLAHSSTLKPRGTFSLSRGISETGVTVILPACGASGDAALMSGMPCFQAGTFAGRLGFAAELSSTREAACCAGCCAQAASRMLAPTT